MMTTKVLGPVKIAIVIASQRVQVSDEYNSSCESSDEDSNVKLSSIFTDSESDFDQPLPPLLSWLESQKRKPPKRNHLLPVPLLCTLIPLQVLSCLNMSPDKRGLQRRF